MQLSIVVATFAVVFLGELPDKTMFANLVMASQGRPLAVWTGAALAFAVHVVIAVSVGVAVFHLIPQSALDAVVAAAFAASAVYSFLIRNEQPRAAASVDTRSWVGIAAKATLVIFVAEWGDLTQFLTAALATRYHSAVSVAVGSLAALWVVAGLAVIAGDRLLRRLSVRNLRIATSVVLLGLAAFTAFQATQ